MPMDFPSVLSCIFMPSVVYCLAAGRWVIVPLWAALDEIRSRLCLFGVELQEARGE